MPPTIGATTGTQLYPHCDDPLFGIGISAWMILGPKSRAGFNAGPVGPPKEITKVPINKPTPILAISID